MATKRLRVYLSFLVGSALAGMLATMSLADAPPVKGQRVFICGHSFHMPVAGMLNEVAKSAGIKDHRLAGSQGIGGSRVIQHWDLADEKNKLKPALRAGTVDVLTLSPHRAMPDEGIDKFTALALEFNPNIRILVQGSWPAFDFANQGSFKNLDRDDAKIDVLRKNYEPYYQKLLDQAKSLNSKYQKTCVYVVPVGQAVITLREKLVEGKVPGFTKQSELFRDPIGHGKPPIYLLATYCHFAVIYGRSPVGLPVPASLKGKVEPGTEEGLNRLLQEIAWDTVTSLPMTGLNKQGKLTLQSRN